MTRAYGRLDDMNRIGCHTTVAGSRATPFTDYVTRCLLALLVMVVTAMGQTTTGIITGLVTDSGGAIDPGSAVTLTNMDTSQVRKQLTNETGAYSFPALPPGNYRLELEHAGFKRFVQEPVEVRVQQTVAINVTLEIGQVSQTLEVTGHADVL